MPNTSIPLRHVGCPEIFALVEISGFAEDQRITRNTPDVRAGVAVVRVDRVEQRLHGGCAEPLGARTQRVLAGDDARRRGSNRDRYDVSHSYSLRKKRSHYIHA